MTEDESYRPNEITLRRDDAYRMAPAQAPAGEEPMVSPVARVHRILKGRYAWAIGIGIVLGAGGAVAGFLIPKPVYRSAGVIDVAPKVAKVLYETEEKGILPMFDSYVNFQAQVASSRRVIDMAMQSPEWQALGFGYSDLQVGKFLERLAVFHPRGSEFIEVSFVSEDIETAMVATNQVIKAYMKVVEEKENEAGLITVQALERQRNADNARLNSLRRDIQAATDDLGTDAQDARYQSIIAQWNKLTGLLYDLDVEIDTAKAVDLAARTAPDHEYTEEEIAARDPGMDDLLQKKLDAEGKVQALGKEGNGPNHPVVLAAKDEVAAVERAIQRRTAAFRKALSKTPELRAMELNDKVESRKRIVILRDSVQDETKRLGAKQFRIATLRAEMSSISERISEAKTRLDQINVESEIHGRISVLAWGERPLGPETDKRNQLALAGGLGGLALGFVLVLLWGGRAAKLRHIVDVDGNATGSRFLGILPELTQSPTAEGGLAATDMGDYCVHHIRTMLQLRVPSPKRIVVLTSPSPGAGKTTLGLALGMSFAATGSRTLLVDLDFIGHGVTSAMRSLVCELAESALLAGESGAEGATKKRFARRSPTALAYAVRQLTFSEARVQELLRAARERAAAGDTTFARLVPALETLDRTPASPPQGPRGSRGVKGALEGLPFEQCVIPTEIPGLALLPVGDATAEDAQALSPQAVNRLLSACRERYDTIIVDSGPILGSLEAALAAAIADEVLMVVARGERRSLVDDALARLERVGASVAGVVFNRASTADVARSSYASRASNAQVTV